MKRKTLFTRVASLLLAGIMTASLAGCGSSQTEETTVETTASTTGAETSAEGETEEAAEETDARAQDGGEGLGEEEAAEEIPAGWACVAYNTGSGWNGVEEDGE